MCGNSRYGTPQWKHDVKEGGKDAFNVELIEECTISDADEREQFWIRALNASDPPNYNVMETTWGRLPGSTAATRICEIKEVARSDKHEKMTILKAVISRVEGVAPKVQVFFETDQARTRRTMPATTFTAENCTMDEAVNRATEFAKRYTQTLEFCTGRTRKDRTLEKWQQAFQVEPFKCIYMRGPKRRNQEESFIELLGETEKASTTRKMIKSVFVVNDQGVDEATRRAVEFAQHFAVPLINQIGQPQPKRKPNPEKQNKLKAKKQKIK